MMEKENITIREYEETDKDQIIELFDEFADYFVRIDDLKRTINGDGLAEYNFGKMMKDVVEKKGKILLADIDGETIGFGAGIIIDISGDELLSSLPGRVGRVIELFVKEDYRATGLGGKMITDFENYFKENDCYASRIDVFGPNKIARDFYEGKGYSIRSLDLYKGI